MSTSTLQKTDSQKVEIGVQGDQRKAVAQELSKFLASTYTLYMKTLYYHWNVTGPNFSGLHKLFEDQYEDLHAAGDELAERIRALGHFTPGTYKEFDKLSVISEDEKLPKSSDQMIRNLLNDNEQCSLEARKVLEVAEEAGDEVTIDMMVSRMSIHDGAAWMLRSTLE